MVTVGLDCFDGTQSTAVYSDCGRHRYLLSRRWDGDAGIILFVMLNPSTATESRNDPTIGRCHRFAIRWNCGRKGGYDICNLFSMITPDQKLLASTEDRLKQRENDRYIAEACRRASRLICAWGGSGSGGFVQRRASETVELISSEFKGPLECLDMNRNGAPTHPLYQPADTNPKIWHSGDCLNDACLHQRNNS